VVNFLHEPHTAIVEFRRVRKNMFLWNWYTCDFLLATSRDFAPRSGGYVPGAV